MKGPSLLHLTNDGAAVVRRTPTAIGNLAVVGASVLLALHVQVTLQAQAASWSFVEVFFGLLAVGLLLTAAYYAIMLRVNRTRYHVGRDTFRVVHTPLPWPGPPPMATSSIDRFENRRTTGYGEYGEWERFDVIAYQHDGTAWRILAGTTAIEGDALVHALHERLKMVRNAP